MLSASGSVPREIGPSHVDNMYSDRHGVWWPDELAPAMEWAGSGCPAADKPLGCYSSFNPFAAVPATLVELSFTEQLQEDQEALQWALHAAGSREATPADRSNQPMARQDGKPDWLSKAGFLAFGSLRSYPLGQHGRLCAALGQRRWPLAQPAVQALVRQALYHLGQLQPQGSGSGHALLWRTGWQEEGGGVLPTLCSELEQLAEELEEAPREHEQLLLLGEVAAFLSGWHEPCRAVARRFAAISSQAASQLQQQVDAAEGKDEMQAMLQAKQTKARMLALLCHASGQLSGSDVAEMLQLMARPSAQPALLLPAPGPAARCNAACGVERCGWMLLID
jgi:hypothetical protein